MATSKKPTRAPIRRFSLTAKDQEWCRECGNEFHSGRPVQAVRIDEDALHLFCDASCVQVWAEKQKGATNAK